MLLFFFINKKCKFVHINKEKETSVKETAIVCKDLKLFIDFIIAERTISEYKLKIGLDGVDSFFKVYLSVQKDGPFADDNDNTASKN